MWSVILIYTQGEVEMKLPTFSRIEIGSLSCVWTAQIHHLSFFSLNFLRYFHCSCILHWYVQPSFSLTSQEYSLLKHVSAMWLWIWIVVATEKKHGGIFQAIRWPTGLWIQVANGSCLSEQAQTDRQMECHRSQYAQEGEELSAELQLVFVVHLNQTVLSAWG